MSWDQLRQQIDQAFSLNDIRTLCFDLAIDYDSLAGEEKVGKVRELLLFVRRTSREDELIAYLSSVRPNISWESVLQTQVPSQPVSPSPTHQTTGTSKTATPKPAPQSQRATPEPAPNQEKDAKPPWWPWGDFPVVVFLGALASLITIILAIPSLLEMAGIRPNPTVAPEPLATTAVVTPSLEPGALASTAAAQPATAVAVVEGTRTAATATAAVAPPVQPTALGGGTGKIAFVSFDRGNVPTIYIVEVGNGVNVPQPLIPSWEMLARRPAWSPDGTRILLNITLGDTVDIYMTTPDGAEPQSVTNNPQSDYSRATWSPDGQRIAFGTTCGADNNEICVQEIGGESQAVNITNHPGQDYDPAWSPTSDQIAFVSDREGAPAIYIMAEDGSGQTRLADGVSPMWSPDGTRIAFAALQEGNYDIYVMNADGSNLQRLTDHPGRDTGPAWSPDGTKIAFVSTRDELNGGAVCNDDAVSCEYTMFHMNIDGSNVTQVTSSVEDSRAPVWQPLPQ